MRCARDIVVTMAFRIACDKARVSALRATQTPASRVDAVDR